MPVHAADRVIRKHARIEIGFAPHPDPVGASAPIRLRGTARPVIDTRLVIGLRNLGAVDPKCVELDVVEGLFRIEKLAIWIDGRVAAHRERSRLDQDHVAQLAVAVTVSVSVTISGFPRVPSFVLGSGVPAGFLARGGTGEHE
jgi:hypothetical protein